MTLLAGIRQEHFFFFPGSGRSDILSMLRSFDVIPVTRPAMDAGGSMANYGAQHILERIMDAGGTAAAGCAGLCGMNSGKTAIASKCPWTCSKQAILSTRMPVRSTGSYGHHPRMLRGPDICFFFRPFGVDFS